MCSKAMHGVCIYDITEHSLWLCSFFIYTERKIEQMNFKERAQKLKSDIPAIFLALKDKDTPIIAKILAAVTVAYALSPIDLIPDFIPVLGYLDDLIILPAMFVPIVLCMFIK